MKSNKELLNIAKSTPIENLEIIQELIEQCDDDNTINSLQLILEKKTSEYVMTFLTPIKKDKKGINFYRQKGNKKRIEFADSFLNLKENYDQ